MTDLGIEVKFLENLLSNKNDDSSDDDQVNLCLLIT